MMIIKQWMSFIVCVDSNFFFGCFVLNIVWASNLIVRNPCD